MDQHTSPTQPTPPSGGPAKSFDFAEAVENIKRAAFGDPAAPNAATRRKAVVGGVLVVVLLLLLTTCAGGNPQKSPKALAEHFANVYADADTDVEFCKAIYPISTEYSDGDDADAECEDNFDDDDREMLNSIPGKSFDGRLDIDMDDLDGDRATATWGTSDFELDMEKEDGKWVIEDFDTD